MSGANPRTMSPGFLRAEISERSLQRAVDAGQEHGYSRTPCVVYAPGDDGSHGNFLPASYRRILADPGWARRLQKTYTGSRHLPHAADRWRGELECASSSDALLMNIFCYPGVLRRPAVCASLNLSPGLRPEFGVRAELAMHRGEVDRTEMDMSLGDMLVEAKLTESGFGRASRERLLRYLHIEELFNVENLPQSSGCFVGYQLIRGVLAAVARDGDYLVLLDGRRSDLVELCFRTLGALRSAEVRHRLRLRTWQELDTTLPPKLQEFLAEKYGIEPA